MPVTPTNDHLWPAGDVRQQRPRVAALWSRRLWGAGRAGGRAAASPLFARDSCAVVPGTLALCFALAVIGYDPQRGLLKKTGRPG